MTTRTLAANQPSVNKMRTLVLIDGDHLSYVLKSLDIQLDFAKFYTFLIELFAKDTLIRYYSSFDPYLKGQQQFFDYLNGIGYLVVASPLQRVGRTQGYTRTALDTLLAIDAISFSEVVESVVLVSGDADFAALLRALKQKGKVTTVIGLPLVTSRVLRDTSDRFLLLEELLLKSISLGEPSQFKITAPLTKKSVAAYYLAKGQYYNNYIVLRNLLRSASNHVTIIDSYVNDEILHIAHTLSPTVRLRVITLHIEGGDFWVLLRKLKREGRDIEVYRCRMFHDRFLRIDTDWWHLGHSIKDLGTAAALIDRVSDVAVTIQLRKDEETVYRENKPNAC